MEIKRAKNLIEEILDLCSQFEDEVLTEACSGIFNTIQSSKSVEEIISCARELMVFVNEAPWEEAELSDIKDEIEGIFLTLLEEFEDF